MFLHQSILSHPLLASFLGPIRRIEQGPGSTCIWFLSTIDTQFWRHQSDCRTNHAEHIHSRETKHVASPYKCKTDYYGAYGTYCLFPSWRSATRFSGDHWMSEIGERCLGMQVIVKNSWSSVGTSWSPDTPKQCVWIKTLSLASG